MAKKKLQFEEAMSRLEEILAKLDNGEVKLAEAVDLYKNGMEMVKVCTERLEEAKGELQVYENGTWVNEEEVAP